MTKQNQKLEAKFFGPFRVLYPVGKQAYKLELPRKWKIHDFFHVSILEQNTTRKGWVDKEARQMEFNTSDNESGEYEVEAIRNSAVYARESESGHLPDLYYLVSWKGYPEEENTWEPASAVQHLRKLISSFHKDHPDKPTTTFLAIDTAPLMARLTIKPTAKSSDSPKWKQRWLANNTNKQAKKNWAAFDFLSCFWTNLGIFHTWHPQPYCTWLHVPAHDCTWLHLTVCDFQPTFIKTSTLWLLSLILELTFLAS